MVKFVEGTYNGFCSGVQSAVNAVERKARELGCVYTYGPIIHNRTVVEELEGLGAIAVEDLSQLKPGDTVIIRSHGVPPQVYEQCRELELRVIDMTCPFVARVQRLAADMQKKGYTVVVAGKADHPEVVGIAGHCGGRARIVSNWEEAERLPWMERCYLLSQTTFIKADFQAISQALASRGGELIVEDTICSSTENRQKEAAELAKTCDAMVVIGGKNSSNTNKLFFICKSGCKNVQIVESKEEIAVEKLPINGIIGIVAGASTPQRSIREVITRMNETLNNTQNIEETAAPVEAPVAEEVVVAVEEETAAPAVEEAPAAASEEAAEPELSEQESFERDLEKTMIRIRPGQVKKGTVVSIVGDDVYVNIGYKADGIIPQAELSLDPKAVASELFQVGDEVSVEILKVNDGEGNVLLSKRKVDIRAKEKEAIAALEDGTPFEVTIKQAVKGGLLAEYLNARVFIPASHVAERYVENIEEFVGKKMTVKALEVDKNRRRIVASRKEILKEEAIAKRKEKYAAFEPGQRVKGIVRRLTDFGAFTDIGGVDGLIHVTDLSWGRVRHPEDIVKVGDEVEVEILSVNPETERIALGYKQLQPKPWDTAMEKYMAGDIIEGRVDRIAPFGAFVEIEPGLFGLVHISQVATRRIEKVEDELRVGDTITVKVLDINPDTKRISLSRRAVLQEARAAQQPAYHRDEDQGYDNSRYVIPPVEETTFTIGDLFPKFDDEDDK